MSSSTLAAGPEEAAVLRPRSLGDLFVSFTLLALQGFGGVLAVAQRELVEHKRWMTNQEFVEEWAVAQIMPGPNVVNLAITLGARYFGWRGALASVAGLVACPLLLLLALALLYAGFSTNPHVAGALRGMGAVAAGLIVATGLKLMPAMRRNALGVPLCAILGALAFALIVGLKLPLLWVLLGLGGVGCVLAFRRLA